VCKMRIWVHDPGRHAAHHGRIHLTARSGYCHLVGQVMRYAAVGALRVRALLHARSHGMTRARMGHVWMISWNCRHHVRPPLRVSSIHPRIPTTSRRGWLCCWKVGVDVGGWRGERTRKQRATRQPTRQSNDEVGIESGVAISQRQDGRDCAIQVAARVRRRCGSSWYDRDRADMRARVARDRFGTGEAKVVRMQSVWPGRRRAK
jgi:hypothetical protein